MTPVSTVIALPEVSIIIPGYNEEAGLEKRLHCLIDALSGWEPAWELILVNDGSTDGTEGIMRAFADLDPRVRVLSYHTNRGRGYALRKGFEAARGRMVVSTEADLSWGPDIVPKLVHALETGEKDVIVASPYLPGGRMLNVSMRRSLISRIGNSVISSTLPERLTMVSGMTRAYRKEVLDSLDLDADGKELHVEILLKAMMLGYRIGEIPATLQWENGRAAERKGGSGFKLRSIVLSHAALWAMERPMFMFGMVGVFLLLAGLTSGFYIVFLRYSGGLNPERPLMTLVVLLVLGGIQLLALGFISVLIVRLRREIVRTQRENRQILSRLGE